MPGRARRHSCFKEETCPLESGQIGSSLVQGQAPSSRATALCPTVLPLKKRPRDDWVASEKAQGSSFSFLFASARSHEGLRLR